MNEFDVILEECVDLIASGELSLEECLSSYPEYAAQLEPILITLVCLQDEGRDVVPPLSLRARIRRELNLPKKDNPKQDSLPKAALFIQDLENYFSGTVSGNGEVLSVPQPAP
jgi:hypothetical protein